MGATFSTDRKAFDAFMNVALPCQQDGAEDSTASIYDSDAWQRYRRVFINAYTGGGDEAAPAFTLVEVPRSATVGDTCRVASFGFAGTVDHAEGTLQLCGAALLLAAVYTALRPRIDGALGSSALGQRVLRVLSSRWTAPAVLGVAAAAVLVRAGKPATQRTFAEQVDYVNSTRAAPSTSTDAAHPGSLASWVAQQRAKGKMPVAWSRLLPAA